MKCTLSLWLALLSVSIMVGCSTPNSSHTQVTPPTAPPQITGLGQAFSITTAAPSWAALVKKTKPTFAWNGRDLLWIQTDAHGQPSFTLDEAYTYQPSNQPLQWVLLNGVHVSGNADKPDRETPRDFYSGQNLHAVAEVQGQVPTATDSGARANYAVTVDTASQFGTVYEIGWQREMSNGSAYPNYGRRIYVLRDATNQWHFLGEGPEKGVEQGGSNGTFKSRVIWESSPTNSLPL